MNGIKVTNPAGNKWNRIIDAVFTVMKYKKITTDDIIYVKVFYYGNLSYLTLSTDDYMNNTNNKTSFPELKNYFSNNLGLNFNKYMSFNNRIFGFLNILLGSLLTILIKS